MLKKIVIPLLTCFLEKNITSDDACERIQHDMCMNDTFEFKILIILINFKDNKMQSFLKASMEAYIKKSILHIACVFWRKIIKEMVFTKKKKKNLTAYEHKWYHEIQNIHDLLGKGTFCVGWNRP